MPDTRAAVATQRGTLEERQLNQARFIERLGPELKRVLAGDQARQDRMVRIAITAAKANSTMAEATPLSLAGAVMTAAVLGLEPNTPTGEAYLVPYKNRGRTEAQLIVGYQGYVKLFWQHPLAADIYAEAVYPEDEFAYERGTNPYVRHVPRPDLRAKDSKPSHYYAVALLTTGARPWVVLTADEVKELRRGKEGPSGDIPDPQRWMERKTALRQLCKMLPKSATLSAAVQADEATGTELYQQRVQAERVQPDDVPGGVDPVTGELEGPDGWPAVPAGGGIVEDPPEGGEG